MRPCLAALALAALSSGCVQVTDFDPVGSAASLAFTWTIDGAFPTTERCADLGASLVRVTFVDGARPVVHGALVRSCATCAQDSPASCLSARPCMRGGAVECYDTEDARVVADGEWTIRVEAVDGSGAVVQASPEAGYSTASGRIALAPTTFLSGGISAQVRIEGAVPTFAACEAAGVEAVELVFEAAGGEIAPNMIEACAVGGVGVRVAPGASYTVRLRALGPGGAVVGETAPETLTIEPGQDATLNGGDPIELTGL